MKKSIFITALFISLFLSSCDSIGLYFDGGKKTINDQKSTIFVPSDIDLQKLSILLFENRIINDTSAFIQVGEYKKLSPERLAAGKYEIEPNTDFRKLLNGFTKNKLGNGNAEKEVEVTFNNCKDIYQVVGKSSNFLELDSTSLINYLVSDSILMKYGFTQDKIGAMFLPNTYRMYWDTSEEDFIERMAKEFKLFWTKERISKLHDTGLNNQSDAVILASIVYKEQDKHSNEWPIISKLYLNRLKDNWPLQSDPTFRFCWGEELDGVQRLTFEHRSLDCPYNTYIYPGLPPGPICIPPADVIDAVLNPSDDDFMFMCAKPKGEGRHNFAKSLKQHNQNAKLYQEWIRDQN